MPLQWGRSCQAQRVLEKGVLERPLQALGAGAVSPADSPSAQSRAGGWGTGSCSFPRLVVLSLKRELLESLPKKEGRLCCWQAELGGGMPQPSPQVWGLTPLLVLGSP